MSHLKSLACTALAAAIGLGTASAAFAADDLAKFYKGKAVTLFIGYPSAPAPAADTTPMRACSPGTWAATFPAGPASSFRTRTAPGRSSP